MNWFTAGRRHALQTGGLASLLLGAGVALAADWPMHAKDRNRSNVTDERLAWPLQPLWVYRAAQPPSPSWTVAEGQYNRMDFDNAFMPVAAQGLLIFGSSADDTLRALDAVTGDTRWTFVAGGPIRFAPQVVGDITYVASDDGCVFALETRTGKPVWSRRLAPEDERLVGNDRMMSRWPIRTGVLVDAGVLYAVAGMWNAEGIYAYALDAATGEVRWCNDMLHLLSGGFGGAYKPDDGHTMEFSAAGLNPQGYLLATSNLLFVAQGYNAPSSLRRATGGVENYLRPENTGGTWLTIDDSDGFLYRLLAPRDGGRGKNLELFAVPTRAKERPRNISVAALLPGTVISRVRYSTVVHGGQVYSREAFGLVKAGGTLIAGERDAVSAYDVATSNRLWHAPVEGEARGLAVADGRLFVSTHAGVLYAFGPGAAGAPKLHAPGRTEAKGEATAPVVRTALAAIRTTRADFGFALVLGDADGSVAEALALDTDLRVVAAATDDATLAKLRERFARHPALLGSHLHAQRVERLDRLPFARYFANAIVVAGPAAGLSARECFRMLRPCGGTLVAPGLDQAATEALFGQTGATPDAFRRTMAGDLPALVRGRLPGARDFDVNADGDRLVKWPLRPLWFGGPPVELSAFADIGLHPPVAANGRYFVTGEEHLTAVDAYTGLILWSRPLPTITPFMRKTVVRRFQVDDGKKDAGPTRNSRQIGYRETVLARRLGADADHVYLTLGDRHFRGQGQACIQIDARTGRQIQLYGPRIEGPNIALDTPQTWPLEIDAAHGGSLALRQEGATLVFALTTRDPQVGAVDAWDLCFDFRPPARRYGLYEAGVFRVTLMPPADPLAKPVCVAAPDTPCPPFAVEGRRTTEGTELTVRLALADVERALGKTVPDSFGFAATLASHDGGENEYVQLRHVFGDEQAAGINNGWATVALAGGHSTPGTDAPVLAGAFDARPAGWAPLEDKAQVASEFLGPRIHPLTGEWGPRTFRSGTGACGRPVYSAVSRIGRTSKGALGLYDFADDSGLRCFGGVAANCGGASKHINMVASQGVLLFTEGRVHCFCVPPFRISFALAPADRRLEEDWAFFAEHNADTRIRQAHLNLNAPGDRRDAAGTLWLSYPGFQQFRVDDGDRGNIFPLAPGSDFRLLFNAPPATTTIKIPLTLDYLVGVSRYTALNADRVRIENTDRPWLYASLLRGISRAVFNLHFPPPLVSGASATPPPLGALGPAWGDRPVTSLPYTKTDLYLRHDAHTLYVAASRPPPPLPERGAPRTPVWSKTVAGEDADVWTDDSMEFFFSDAAGARVLHLGVAASGARYDARAEGGAKPESKSWNGAWKSGVAAAESNFTVTLALPLKTLVEAGIAPDTLALNLQVNQKDRRAILPTYPPGNVDKRIADLGGLLTESLLALGPLDRARCAHFAPVGLGTAPNIAPVPYTVRLHFAELDADVPPGRRVFDVRLQGKPVLEKFDVAREAGGPRKALVKEFKGVLCDGTLELEFKPAGTNKPDNGSAPILNALELMDETWTPPRGGP